MGHLLPRSCFFLDTFLKKACCRNIFGILSKQYLLFLAKIALTDNKASRSVHPLTSPCSEMSGEESSTQGNPLDGKRETVYTYLFREMPTEIGKWNLEKLVLIVCISSFMQILIPL